MTFPTGQDVIHPISNPVRKSGGFAILRGNLATEGGVLKTAGVDEELAPRACEGLRQGGGRAPGDHREEDQPGRRGRRALRGAEGRAWDARDARRHGRDRRPGPEGLGRAPDRREVLRRDPRLHDRAHRPRGCGRRGRSGCSRTATSSPSTSRRGRSTSSSPTRSSPRGGRPGSPCRRSTRTGSSPSTRSSSRRLRRARSAWCPARRRPLDSKRSLGKQAIKADDSACRAPLRRVSLAASGDARATSSRGSSLRPS